MKWAEYSGLQAPADFHFGECLSFLGRSDTETTHSIKDGHLYKLLKSDGELILVRISEGLKISFLGDISEKGKRAAGLYIQEWLDLDRDLTPFYELAALDPVLWALTENYRGLRIAGIPDLFEALSWAVIGQQINLTFAYTLKKRLVEAYGEKHTILNETYWLFPQPEAIAELQTDDLRKLQFTGRKAEYMIGIAKAVSSGELAKKALQKLDDQQVRNTLMSIRGVGAWTADYVMMKSFRRTAAFPIGDAGLHNALKAQLNLPEKPALDQIKKLAARWEGWQAYAVFYLWRSLYE
ncbi:DNA-3-methyladenine glycosylase [Metabacillus sp. GX 13764]|uniref:DNA-3-methyladenine glycosylase family protein n=1 Tax=Metabacillus kandeliae TaxID=2900151 RepID=UPI001E55DA75|nr:DNA-3-methyladenine glycosylase [Metabacillus kandeliae]MCD7034075.1 DNA-3-methyladenine glycosylase [Metabacillus kandeliae]